MKVVNLETTSFWIIFVFTKLKYSFRIRPRHSEYRVDPVELHFFVHVRVFRIEYSVAFLRK